jgi:maleate isomerase
LAKRSATVCETMEIRMQQPFELDRGSGSGNRLGLVVLSTDTSMEYELRSAMGQPDVAVFHTRIPFDENVTRETLQAMRDALPGCVSLLPPDLDVIGYGCTAGATQIGSENVASEIQSVHPKAKVTDPINAVRAALKALGASKIGLVTPYIPDVARPMKKLLQSDGLTIAAELGFNQVEDAIVARITEASVLGAVKDVAKMADCDAIFVSCTNLRAFGIVEAAEEATGIPVISSNLALAWHMLKLSGRDTSGCGPGKLFSV